MAEGLMKAHFWEMLFDVCQVATPVCPCLRVRCRLSKVNIFQTALPVSSCELRTISDDLLSIEFTGGAKPRCPSRSP
eukprot:1661049-Amphidinium_carterae.1